MMNLLLLDHARQISRDGLLMGSVVFHSNMEDVAGIETGSSNPPHADLLVSIVVWSKHLASSNKWI